MELCSWPKMQHQPGTGGERYVGQGARCGCCGGGQLDQLPACAPQCPPTSMRRRPPHPASTPTIAVRPSHAQPTGCHNLSVSSGYGDRGHPARHLPSTACKYGFSILSSASLSYPLTHGQASSQPHLPITHASSVPFTGNSAVNLSPIISFEL